jgi:hypothetical protein
MNYKFIFLLAVLLSCHSPGKIAETPVNHFPVTEEKISSLPAQENFYIFLLAGQSNMAGRGFVQPSDTISSSRVLMLNKDNQWVYAKEPLHYYEPGRTGLDCGLSFGKELSRLYGKNITIGLVPCAVGGSSIEQWLGDSTYRGVTLYSNFIGKARAAMQSGMIKGLLWHQGESNAGARSYKNYRENLQVFFGRIRKDINQPDLPVYAGKLGSFLKKASNPNAEAVNKDLELLSSSYKNFHVISTSDLTPNTDTIHFDSRSQREMGKRFAKEVYRTR